MKYSAKTTALVLGLAAFGVTAAAAAPTHKARKAGSKFAQMDTNRDGRISFAEAWSAREAAIERSFERMDANGDGAIDRAEMASRQTRKAMKNGARKQQRSALHTKRNRNRGRVRVNEAHAHTAAKRANKRFNRLDRNRDNRVTIEEMLYAGAHQAKNQFRRADRNGDWQLSKDETKARRKRSRASRSKAAKRRARRTSRTNHRATPRPLVSMTPVAGLVGHVDVFPRLRAFDRRPAREVVPKYTRRRSPRQAMNQAQTASKVAHWAHSATRLSTRRVKPGRRGPSVGLDFDAIRWEKRSGGITVGPTGDRVIERMSL